MPKFSLNNSSKKFIPKISKRFFIFIGVITVIDLSYFSASYFFGRSIDYPYFLIPYLIVSINFLIKTPIGLLKKLFIILGTFFLTAITGILLLFSTMTIPGSKNHDYIMYKVCLPVIDKYYATKGINRLSPPNDKNAAGEYRWWVQHLECEKNVREGKGPIFSENPPGFPVINKNNEDIWKTIKMKSTGISPILYPQILPSGLQSQKIIQSVPDAFFVEYSGSNKKILHLGVVQSPEEFVANGAPNQIIVRGQKGTLDRITGGVLLLRWQEPGVWKTPYGQKLKVSYMITAEGFTPEEIQDFAESLKPLN